MSSTTKSNKRGLKKSADYYFTNMTFQVEDRLYNVPINAFLEESWPEGPFCTMLSLPSGDNQEEGTMDTTPVKLQGITRTDFENLLRLLYPRGPVTTRPSNDTWMSVLKLAHMWEMDALFELAVAEVLLNPTDPIRMICYAFKYSIQDWPDPAYQILASRKDPLSEDEAEEIGVQATVKVFHMREIAAKRNATWISDDNSQSQPRPMVRRRVR